MCPVDPLKKSIWMYKNHYFLTKVHMNLVWWINNFYSRLLCSLRLYWLRTSSIGVISIFSILTSISYFILHHPHNTFFCGPKFKTYLNPIVTILLYIIPRPELSRFRIYIYSYIYYICIYLIPLPLSLCDKTDIGDDDSSIVPFLLFRLQWYV